MDRFKVKVIDKKCYFIAVNNLTKHVFNNYIIFYYLVMLLCFKLLSHCIYLDSFHVCLFFHLFFSYTLLGVSIKSLLKVDFLGQMFKCHERFYTCIIKLLKGYQMPIKNISKYSYLLKLNIIKYYKLNLCRIHDKMQNFIIISSILIM